MPSAQAATVIPAGCQLRAAGEAHAARKPLCRYRLRCLDGRRTVRRLRPFFRRRDRTARPHTSFIRARNPCLLMRRRLRGRYVGPIHYLSRGGETTTPPPPRAKGDFSQKPPAFSPPPPA